MLHATTRNYNFFCVNNSFYEIHFYKKDYAFYKVLLSESSHVEILYLLHLALTAFLLAKTTCWLVQDALPSTELLFKSAAITNCVS